MDISEALALSCSSAVYSVFCNSLYLTLSLLILLILYTLPYWSNPPFLIFDIQALWRSGMSARVPECQKLKMVGLDQCGDGPFEQWQFRTTAVEGVKAPEVLDINMPLSVSVAGNAHMFLET